jgi:small subunit ribosomal protein S1
LTGIDPNHRRGDEPLPEPPSSPPDSTAEPPSNEQSAESARRPFLIGSQRDPAAYRRRRRRDWTPVEEPPSKPEDAASAATPAAAPVTGVLGAKPEESPPLQTGGLPRRHELSETPRGDVAAPGPSDEDAFPQDMDAELDRALDDTSFDALMRGGDVLGDEEAFEPESRHTGRVVAVRRDEVFLELGGREQGCVPLRQFSTPPKPGDILEVVVQRLNADDGLYDLRLPEAAADVSDWADLNEGMSVEAQVTGHNTGGLECEVNHIRGFIPISQVAIYRVEDLAQFVGQRMTCVVTEANPMRRNLVLSRREVLEREKEEARQKLLDSLQPGQVHQGVVRKLMDFGAFVDIGGVDGLVHVSQLAWNRVNHPREVLAEGQKIQVKIEKIDRTTGKIGLSYRDLLENPWTGAAGKYPPNSVVHGKVTKLMEFGAFVELEPGVEGLVHISELSHKRVWRASDVVHEGDEIDLLVLSVNTEAQRISLSLRALSKPEPAKKEKEEAEAGQPAPPPASKRKRRNEPLQGGLGKAAGGEPFGLNW